jgi:hypothetical protein
MAKKSNIPDNIQKQFEKPQFKIGDPVFFTWLGSKKYGYVTAFKTVGWGIQYTVEEDNVRYPCGIEIKTHKTTYTTGYIRYDETRAIGRDELITRIQTGHSSTYSELFIDTRRTAIQSRSESTTSKRVSTKNTKGIKSTESITSGKDVIQSSSNGNSTGTRKKRGNSELDTAIKKQRDFLNGFVKKD